MQTYEVMLHEYIARKDQVLNLEMRLFILVLALEALFIFLYLIHSNKVRETKAFSFGSACAYFILLFELIAINGKMGLISMYLRQMESFMATLGFVGAIWESKALDAIIFVPGNAFTLPAGLTILFILFQTAYVFYVTFGHVTSVSVRRIILTVIASAILVILIAKCITVDFRKQVPNVFPISISNTEAKP